MPDVKTESVRVDGLNVRFQHAGQGPALVLVHGLLGYSFSWRFALPILSADRDVFAPDMPGSGFSDTDDSLECDVGAAARRLGRFMDALRIKECDLLGSSFGGTTALMFATQQPGRLRTLTLVSPANPWSSIGRKRLALLNVSVLGAMFPSFARMAHPLRRYYLGRMYGDPRAVTRETIEGYSLPLAQPGRYEHGVKIARSWRRSMLDLEKSLPAAARIPTLLVWGSKDRLVDPASAAQLKQHLGNARMSILDGAGHLPYEERPEEFCRVVRAFLNDHSQSQGAGREVT